MKWCRSSVLMLLFSFMILSCAKENQCPGSKASCPEHSTCCKLLSGSYGCCPIKNAVCCQDSVHCCPEGYTCDVTKAVCQMGDKSKPLLKKIPTMPTMNEIAEGNVVICASGDWQCPPDHSCCSVPGSDQFHCCPGGYSCDLGLCQESRIEFPAAVFTSSAAKIVKCNQEFACPDRHTCCKANKSYLCCPLPQAVCCSDQMHCCPRGFKCSNHGKTCSSGIDTLLALTTLSPMSLKKTTNKLLGLLMQGAKQDKASKQNVNASSVVCPDGASECPDGNTCCKLSSGQWGCCPLPNAVCCSDGVHCCPNGYTCDVSAGTCSQRSKRIPLVKKLSSSNTKPSVYSVVCPDGESQCPDGNTCCKLASGEWGCCPLPQAVCCSDGIHCCPNGYTCDVSAGTCSQGRRNIPMVAKLPVSKRKVDADSVVCPDGASECPDGNTCCKLSSGQWGCCPLPNAVCCSDGVHCCPNGYTCDVSAGTCSQGRRNIPMVAKLPVSKRKVDADSVVCPDGASECPDGNTCCKLSSGQWGCCPLPNAVCCSDGVHCCPNGYTCDVSAGTCSQGRRNIPMVAKLPVSKRKVDADSVVCPDGASECPDGNTCCKLSSGQWGCCPLPNAVCCSDGVHCCPNGYTCDVSAGTCSQRSKSIPLLKKLLSSKTKPSMYSVVCPDGESQCPDGNTCCKLASGEWGCCPLPQAVCCSDGIHCCPNGYTCDVSTGSCIHGSRRVPLVAKLLASKRKVDVDSVVCPDGESQCPDGNTCCKLASGEWGCCPLPQAVCCSDGIHCCPNGYTCDVSTGSCIHGSRPVPLVAKLLASKRKVDVDSVVCPDGESKCPDGNTCCKLASGEWGCCPLPQAVCCSDGIHCCPNGYTCDVSTGSCIHGSRNVPLVAKLLASKRKVDVDSVVCPDGESKCPDGNTCCKLASGEWGCCPLPQAVCCSDGIHCCPNGYTCDVSTGSCIHGSRRVPLVAKLLASKRKVDVDSVVCPDGESQCPDGNTCCKLASGEWGCCPLPQAVCCSDGIHCCPNGYTCDVSTGSCIHGSRNVPLVAKLLASKRKVDVDSVVCPDGESKCPDGNTCCKLASGEWGCCPLPQAVCCSDGIHCCPNGYTCDVSTGTCSQKSKSIPLLKKLSSSKTKPNVYSIVCPDGESQCPDGNTCCKLASGEWGCCPLPQAVCCSDGIHCCPNGYTCDVSTGTCSQKSKSIPLLKKLSSSKTKPNVYSIVCPDGESQCPDGNTCCKLASGEWGCCPLPQAVCCSDGIHCCPNGYTCDVSTGTCSQKSKSIPLLKKLSSSKTKPNVYSIVCPDGESQCPDGNTCCKLASGEWGCCPLPQAVCCSDGIHCCPNGYTCDVSTGTCSQKSKSIPLLKKLSSSNTKPNVYSVVCPDGESQCPDGNTCCKLASGEWGCCPLPQAVCCSDGIHCCPNGYTCDVSTGTCSQKSKSIPLLKKLSSSKTKPNVYSIVCPDGKSQCPDGNTCCKLASGEWGCCPLPQAVCCSDGIHCCPNGYTCDVSTGTCSQKSKGIPLLKKLSSSKTKPNVYSVVCPDGKSQCPDGNTCCKLASGEWGCCPLPQAVCCSDGIHCCPNGYTCDVSTGTCSQKSKSIPLLKKLSSSNTKLNVYSVVCPDGESQCPDGNTCCKLASGEWGCCPLPQAVCCSDGIHCCPNGYTCDASTGTCSQGSRRVPMVPKLPASKRKVDVDSVICPDKSSECPDGNTCCKLSSGQWGCCPLPNAVCCSDGKHCCPNGYTCDVSAGTCGKGGLSISMFQKVPAVTKTSGERAFDGIVCPDKKYQCPKGNTCCKVSSETYGCCPLKDAVCCSDNKHCCPEGYTCDLKQGRCNKTAEHINVINNIPVIRTSTDAEVKYVNCPDGSTCMDYETCCELPEGEYGCCPMPKAVCCEDHKHCCPQGYRCDVTEAMCVTGNVRLPIMQKTKPTLRPKTDHANLNEKLHFIPGRAQDENMLDDDAVLWLQHP